VALTVGNNEDFRSSKETPPGRVLLEKPVFIDGEEIVHTFWKQLIPCLKRLATCLCSEPD